jgi:hypothetical protein
VKETAVSSSINGQLVPFLLGIVVVGIVLVIASGNKSIPLLSNPKLALIAIFVIGFAMCTNGIGAVAASGKWTSPIGILGILLGIAILVIVIAALAGWKLPFIEGDTQAIIAVTGLIGVKFLIGTVSMLLRWL